jgi:hypothetical protein
MDGVVVVADALNNWLSAWDGLVLPFEEALPERLSGFRIILVAPGDAKYIEHSQTILNWKRDGLLGSSRIILATYKGRHLWSPDNDSLAERWVVHARSESQILDSDRLAFVPLCLNQPRRTFRDDDDGYLFMGGRKWREPELGLSVMASLGLPARVITDRVPEGDWPGVEILREKIPKADYINVLERARVFMVPLRQTAASHGHVDVITAMLVGTPVVVTAGASCDDYVRDGVTGILVHGNTHEAWVEAVHVAWSQASEFRKAAQRYAPDYYAPKYAEYLRELVSSLD